MMSDTRYEHIVLNDGQIPTVSGTSMKVVELVLDHLAYGWSPEELRFQHPNLTMGQIYSALAYYWDHKDQLDEEIQRRLVAVDKLRYSTPRASLVNRLKARGRE